MHAVVIVRVDNGKVVVAQREFCVDVTVTDVTKLDEAELIRLALAAARRRA